MQHVIEATVEPNGTIILQGLPFREGEKVEIMIQTRSANGEVPAVDVTSTEGRAANTRIAGLHAGAIWMREDFDEPLPDEFWLGAS